MAACLRSLRLGMPPLVAGGAGGGRHLGRTTRRGVASLHISTGTLKATPAPRQHQQKQRVEAEGGVAGGGHGHTVMPLHSFDPLGFTLFPAAHTLDDIEVQCSNREHSHDLRIHSGSGTERNGAAETSIRTFRLPPNALWYPRDCRHLQDGAALCSVAYSRIEREVMDSVTKAGHQRATQPLRDEENGAAAEDGGSSRVAENGVEEDGRFGCVNRGEDGRYGVEDDRFRVGLGVGDVNGVRGHGGVCDMALFIKSMGLGNGEVQSCSLSSTLPSSSSPSSSPSSSSSGKADPSGKPSPEQLSHVFNCLAETLPKLFVQPLNYTIYAQDVVFENRIRGVRTVGLFSYVRQVSLLRTVGHLRFAYVKFEILKITKHPEEGTVKVRWRIKGLSGLKAFVQFWKIKLWDWTSVEQQMVNWYDGFSTFHVGGDGLVHLHVADSMMPDEEKQVAEKDPLAVKLATLFGLVHRPTSGNLTTATETPATTTATAATAAGVLLVVKEDRESCEGLMFPLEKIY